MPRFLLATATALLVMAAPANATPGQPGVFYIPPKVMPSIEGTNKVTVGWREVDFGPGSGALIYSVTAVRLSADGSYSTSVAGSGNPDEDRTATLELPPGHSYRLTVRAFQGGDAGPVSNAQDFVFDATGPVVDATSSPYADRWTSRATITFEATSTNTDAASYQLDTTFSGYRRPAVSNVAGVSTTARASQQLRVHLQRRPLRAAFG